MEPSATLLDLNQMLCNCSSSALLELAVPAAPKGSSICRSDSASKQKGTGRTPSRRMPLSAHSSCVWRRTVA